MTALTFGLVVVVLLALTQQSYAACKKKKIREQNCLNDTCSIVCNKDSQNTSTCYDTKMEWNTACVRDYKGVVNGGRCFFTLNTTATWTESWQLCADKGGTLAQIHTFNEFANITAYLQMYFNANVEAWIAMSRNYTTPPSCNQEFLDETLWHESVTQYSPKLTFGNTWIRNRFGDDCGWYGDYCFEIVGGKAGDATCSRKFYPLCSITNKNQNFTAIPNACIAEQAIETLTTIDVKTCGQECVNFDWCRGFNFWASNNTCQLFSWTFDTNDINGAKSTPSADCYAYSYVP